MPHKPLVASQWAVEGQQPFSVKPTLDNLYSLDLHVVAVGERDVYWMCIAVPIAAALIRSGRLVPLLLEHMTDSLNLFVYYGSRATQPARVRRFIDLAVERLTESNDFVLTSDELASVHAKGMAALLRAG